MAADVRHMTVVHEKVEIFEQCIPRQSRAFDGTVYPI